MAESDIGDMDVQEAPEERLDQRSAAERIREHTFPLAVRGYDRQAVDDFVDQVADLVTDLEGRQTRETVVRRALDQVGEETAGILQRAHQAADELAARSRAQADGRLQRAAREAEVLRSQADEYAEKVTGDTQLLWDERQRLLDDLRQLADDVLATADDASERLTLPEQLGPAEEQAALPADQPTAEVELDVLPGGAGLDDRGQELEDDELAEPGLQEEPLEGAPLDEAPLDEPPLEQAPLDDRTLEEQAYEDEGRPRPGDRE